jgi:hypothetical protein
LGGEGGGEEEEGEEEAHSISDCGLRIAEARRPRPAGSLWLAVCLRLSALRFAPLGCGLENGEWMMGLG